MTEFEKKTGLVDLEELTKESDEVMGGKEPGMQSTCPEICVESRECDQAWRVLRIYHLGVGYS